MKSFKLNAVSVTCDSHGWIGALWLSSCRRNLALPSMFWVAILCLLPSPVVAQWRAGQEPHGPILKVDVDLVTLNFSIRDKARHTVSNVQKEDIAIFEDEAVSQEVTFFDAEPAPLSLIVLLDVSESVLAFSSQIKATSKVLPDLLREGDEVAV